MSTNDAVTSASSMEKMLGCVKWFNNKAGYGFISLIDGADVGKEIFVHHSGIGVNEQQYKYLVQGEYVEFVLSSTQGGQHEFQAVNVTGIRGGKLMCETIYEMKIARSNYKSKNDNEMEISEPVVPTPKSSRPPRDTESKPVRRVNKSSNTSSTINNTSDEKEWSQVNKGKRRTKASA